jgi:hypothetical protein
MNVQGPRRLTARGSHTGWHEAAMAPTGGQGQAATMTNAKGTRPWMIATVTTRP